MSAKGKTVYVLHTGFATVDVLKVLLAKAVPEARIVNIVDDSLLADARAAGHVTPSIIRRMIGYATLAQSAGADAILNACSSVGEVADLMRQAVDIPVVKVDESMAEDAVGRGGTVAVVATVPTTLGPTVRLVESKARAAGKAITVNRHLVEGAFDVLMSGNPEKHDQMVSAEIERAAASADVVVLAQASMARLVPQLQGRLRVPVLSSPAAGVANLKRVLEEA